VSEPPGAPRSAENPPSNPSLLQAMRLATESGEPQARQGIYETFRDSGPFGSELEFRELDGLADSALELKGVGADSGAVRMEVRDPSLVEYARRGYLARRSRPRSGSRWQIGPMSIARTCWRPWAQADRT
jgi:hypothetical protein